DWSSIVKLMRGITLPIVIKRDWLCQNIFLSSEIDPLIGLFPKMSKTFDSTKAEFIQIFKKDKLPLLTTIVITILVLIPGLNCKLPYKPNERNCLQVLDHIFFWTITNQSTRITTHIAHGTQGFGGIGFTNQQKTYILV